MWRSASGVKAWRWTVRAGRWLLLMCVMGECCENCICIMKCF